MPAKISLVFFGSFQEYSAHLLSTLAKHFHIPAVVTTPPKPAGRDQTLTPTDVANTAHQLQLPLFELDNLSDIPSELATHPPDFLLVAGYGKLIPANWLSLPKIMAINFHPSLLPLYPGRMPGEWAILNGETESGITLIKMSAKFDQGDILVQIPITLTPQETKLSFYTRAYELGANLITETLPKISAGLIQPQPQPQLKNAFYARNLTREDGYVPFAQFMAQLTSHHPQLTTKWRALFPWPGVWTTDSHNKRIKLIDPYQLLVQYEGERPKPWRQS